MKTFERYSAFTNIELLRKYSLKPLRKSKRVNTTKISIKKFEQYAASRGWSLERIPWCPEGFFIDRDDRETALGKDLLHMIGATYMQEAASMLPVALLDPKPSEIILDMSASPGSKTTQIAARMEGRGVLVANDMQEKRLWTLNANLQRCGVTNAIVVKKVGQWYSRHMTERFDRVLCDAPCTAQGTLRKDPTALNYSSDDNIRKMARLQCDLLEAAVHACKVGGRIVYSTCTLTPEENEGVISFILNKFSEQVFSFDLGLDKIHDFKLQQAIDDAKRVQDLQKYLRSFQAFRLWPQTYDTEGFFCAILEKRAPTRPVDRMDFVERFEQRLSKSATQSIARSLTQWYGVPFLHDDEALASSKKQIFMTTKEALQFPLPTSDFAMGLPFGKPTDHGLPRLSHEMATLRGMEATTQIIDVNSDAFLALLRGENLKGVSRKSIADGDVLLHYNALEDFTVCVGRGLLKNNDIWNRLPREIVRMHG